MPHRQPKPAAQTPEEDTEQDPLAAGMTLSDLRQAQRRVHDTAIHALTQQMAEMVEWQRRTKTAMGAADSRLRQLEQDVADLKALTGEIRDLLTTVKSGFKVLGWLGTAFKWGGALAAAATAIYTAFYMLTHGGHPPGKG